MKEATINEVFHKIQSLTGMTQAEIADRVGYSRPYLNRVLSGKDGNTALLEGKLRQEFAKELSDMYITTTAVKVKTSTSEDKKMEELERRIKAIEDQLALILLLLKK